MKRKLIPFFLSAAVLLTSCSSSGNKTTDGSTTASDVSQTVSGSNQAESVSSAEETEQAQGKTPAVVAQGAEIGAAVVLIELAAGLDAEQCLAILKIAGVQTNCLL